MIIAIVGLIGSGKTEAISRFIERGFFRVGFNDVVYEEVERRDLERTEPSERRAREELRKESGMGVMALKSLPKIEAALAQGMRVAVESLYSWSEYKIVKERFGDDFRVLAIYAPPHIRYERLGTRPTRALSFEMAKSRDEAEIENIEKGGPIAIADWTIQNTGAKEQFFAAVDELIEQLLV